MQTVTGTVGPDRRREQTVKGNNMKKSIEVDENTVNVVVVEYDINAYPIDPCKRDDYKVSDLPDCKCDEYREIGYDPVGQAERIKELEMRVEQLKQDHADATSLMAADKLRLIGELDDLQGMFNTTIGLNVEYLKEIERLKEEQSDYPTGQEVFRFHRAWKESGLNFADYFDKYLKEQNR